MQVKTCCNKPSSRAPNKLVQVPANIEIGTDKTSEPPSIDFSCGRHLLAEGSHEDFITTKIGYHLEEIQADSRQPLETMADSARERESSENGLQDQDYHLRIAMQLNNFGVQLTKENNYRSAIKRFSETTEVMEFVIPPECGTSSYDSSCVKIDQSILTATAPFLVRTGEGVTQSLPVDTEQLRYEHAVLPDASTNPMLCCSNFFFFNFGSISERVSSLKNKDEISLQVYAVALYNCALSYNLLYFTTQDLTHLQTALALYNMAYSVIGEAIFEGASAAHFSFRELVLSIRNNVGKIYHDSKAFDKAQDVFLESVEVLHFDLPSLSGDSLDSIHIQSDVSTSKQTEASTNENELLLSNFCSFCCHNGPSVSVQSLILSNASISMFHLKDYDMVIHLCKIIHQKFSVSEMHNESLAAGATVAYQTGIACSNYKDFWKALESFQLALQFHTARATPDPIWSSHRGNVLRAIGETQMKLQLLPEAIVSFKKACQVTQSVLGPNHIYVAETILSIGQLHHMNGDYNQALSDCKRALLIGQIVGLGINLMVEIFLLVGAVYDDLGKFDSAINQFHLCLDLLRNSDACEMKGAKVFALRALCTLHIKKVKLSHAEGPKELCKLKPDEREMLEKIQQDMVLVLDSKKLSLADAGALK